MITDFHVEAYLNNGFAMEERIHIQSVRRETADNYFAQWSHLFSEECVLELQRMILPTREEVVELVAWNGEGEDDVFEVLENKCRFRQITLSPDFQIIKKTPESP